MRRSVLPLACLVLAATACKAREFNAGTSQITNPDDPDAAPARDCPKGRELRDKAGAAFVAYISSARNTAEADLIDELASLIDTASAREIVQAVRAGRQIRFEDYLLDGCQFQDAWAANDANPSRPNYFYQLSAGRMSHGGLVMFRHDIFPEGFYRTRAGDTTGLPAIFARRGFTQRGQFFTQPYLKWENGTYVYHHATQQDNASARLIDLVLNGGQNLALYRGTSLAYDTKEELLRVGANGRIGCGAMSRFGSDFCSLMTTPDKEAAKGWASPRVISLAFTAAEAKSLVQQQLLYAGIEYDYLEIAPMFSNVPNQANQAVLNKVKQECDVVILPNGQKQKNAAGQIVCNPVR